MDPMQQLLHDKGAIYNDIEYHTAQLEVLRAALNKVNQQLAPLIQEKNAKPVERDPAVA